MPECSSMPILLLPVVWTICKQHPVPVPGHHRSSLSFSVSAESCSTPLVIKKWKYSITPTLHDDLHRLLELQLLFIYKCRHQLAPSHLTSVITPVLALKILQSARARWPSHTENQNCRLWSPKLFSCWSIIMKQFADGIEGSITDSWAVSPAS